MRATPHLLALLMICMPAFAAPSADDLAKMIEKIAVETKVVARMGLDGPVSAFKSDGDQGTLEIVFLDHADPNANTISEDGEAIFLYEASDDLQSQLIGKAFRIRAQRRLAAR